MTTRLHEDIEFTRFRATGNPESLAEVYDATAAELLRVASHLAGDRATAEDLVQATFLVAIERAASWDPERPVRPWLLGILANQARLQRWRASRAPAPERLRRSSAASPAESAQLAEFDAALESAIAALPKTYRPVVDLHLRQGLIAQEIAARLERPPGTARTQVMRGMRLLRKALPPGFATIAVVRTAPARGLAGVRSAVLARAKTPAMTVLGAKTVNALLLPIAAAACVAGVLTLALAAPWTRAQPLPAVPAVSSDAADEGRSEASATDPGGARSAARSDPDAGRSDAEGGQARTLLADAAIRAAVRIAVRWADGAAAAGVGVIARRADRHHDLYAQQALTDENGMVTLHAPAEQALHVSGDRGGDVTVEPTNSELGRDAILEIPQGLDVGGVVVDEGGVPIPKAEIWLAEYGASTYRIVGRTDGAGRFRLASVGAHRSLAACAAEFAMSRPRLLTGKPGMEVKLRLVLGAGITLRGRVVDGSGTPVSDALVEAGPWREDANVLVGVSESVGEPSVPGSARVLDTAPVLRTRTDADGRFRIAGRRRGALVRLRARAPGFGPVSGVVIAFEGAPEWVATLPDHVVVQGSVTDAGRRPVPGARVHAGDPDDFDGCWAITDDHGRYVLSDLPPERELVVITEHRSFARGRDNAGHARTTITGEPGATIEWNPRLATGRTISGTVLDEHGRPHVRCHVAATDERPDESGRHRLRTVWTDDDGHFAFGRLPDSTFRIEWTPHGLDEHVHALTRIQLATEPLAIRIPRRDAEVGRILGRVVDAAGRPLQGVEVVTGRPAGAGGRVHRTDERGAFTSHALPPRSYLLYAQGPGGQMLLLPPVELGPGERRDLGTLTLPTPGRLQVRVLLPDGRPAEEMFGEVFAADGRHAGALEFDQGSGRSSPLSPGRHVVAVRPPWRSTDGDTGERRAGVAAQVQEVEVRSGVTTEVEIRLRRGVQCLFAVVQTDPRRRSGLAEYTVRDEAGELITRGVALGGLDDSPMLVYTRLPLGVHDLSVETAAGLRGRRRVTVDGSTGSEVPIPIEVR